MNNIIITGASSGVGQATAECFLAAGWNVGLIARRSELLKQVAAGAENALVLPCDVTDDAAVEQAFDRFVDRFGRLDNLFNNAGLFVPGGTPDEISIENWKTSVDVNLTGSFLCARKAFAVMRAQSPQGGRIINNGSISAYAPRPFSTPYTTTKHAITGLTKSISLDGRPFNIACGQIDIGNAATEMVEVISKGVTQADGSIKAEPIMDVAHVADSVLDMAKLSLDTNIQFMTIMATKMPYVGRG